MVLERLRTLFDETQSTHLRQRLAAAGIDGAGLESLEQLNRLPLLRKDDLRQIQAAQPPFGGLLGVPPEQLARIFQSPGPIYDPQGHGADYWGWREAFAAAGLVPGDIAMICFSYHLTPAGQMFDDSARALGCVAIPAGIGNQEQQLLALLHTGATAYVGLPSYLKALLDTSARQNVPLSLRKAFVCAEPLPPSLRQSLESAGINVQQGYGTADLGCVAYECELKDGMHLRDDLIVQICDPASEQPLPDGEVGEIVVTTLNPVYPMVRFGTGDLSALSGEPCGCGRPSARLLGIRGRVGQGIKVRGLFVYPHQLAAVFAGL
ncbi:MAG TPA: AMP-binding protein, partial [Herpetosiphonaceae bacterium]|nr:AMP-binding protein [Herpetosiphonaceae bacterium]